MRCGWRQPAAPVQIGLEDGTIARTSYREHSEHDDVGGLIPGARNLIHILFGLDEWF